MKLSFQTALVLLVLGFAIYQLRPNLEVYFTDEQSSRPTIQALTNSYQQVNKAYFYGSLPEDKTTIQFMDSENNMASIHHVENDRWLILIDRKSNPLEKIAEESVIHEACHQANKLVGEEEGLDSHGVNFQACMLRVATMGGFNNLW